MDSITTKLHDENEENHKRDEGEEANVVEQANADDIDYFNYFGASRSVSSSNNSSINVLANAEVKPEFSEATVANNEENGVPAIFESQEHAVNDAKQQHTPFAKNYSINEETEIGLDHPVFERAYLYGVIDEGKRASAEANATLDRAGIAIKGFLKSHRPTWTSTNSWRGFLAEETPFSPRYE
jgi:hypothetical protein